MAKTEVKSLAWLLVLLSLLMLGSASFPPQLKIRRDYYSPTADFVGKNPELQATIDLRAGKYVAAIQGFDTMLSPSAGTTYSLVHHEAVGPDFENDARSPYTRDITKLPLRPLRVAEIYSHKAIAYAKMKNWAYALKFYNQALVIRTEKLGSNHPSVAVCYNNIAGVYADRASDVSADKAADRAAAIKYYQSAMDIFQRNPGSVPNRKRKSSLAGSDVESTIMSRVSYRSANLTQANTWHNLGIVYTEMGKTNEAIYHFGRALHYAEVSQGPLYASRAESFFLPWSSLRSCW
jgi:tetratricopeptide (TPR) repeat protein